MPSKEPCMCPICHCPDTVNLSQHLNGVHGIGGQDRKQLIQRGHNPQAKNLPEQIL